MPLRRHLLPLLLAVALCLTVLGPSADAAFPGAAGEIFLSTGGEIVAIAPDGSRRTVREGFSANVEVTPDGRFLALQTEANGFELISTAGGPRQIILDDTTVGGKPEFAWSPDGAEFVVRRLGPAGLEFARYDADGTNARPLPEGTDGAEFVWSVDGFLYTPSPATRIDPTTGAQTRFNPDGYSITGNDRGIDASPDGTRLATSCFLDGQPPLGVCVTDTSFNLQTFIPPPPGTNQAEYAHFSPDGSRIVFDTFSSQSVEEELGLFTANLDGSDVRQLAGGVDTSEPPEWGRVPDTPPTPLEEPPPPPSNEALACGGFDGDPGTTERADFTDPILYAVAVSQARFGCGGSGLPNSVVLSRDDNFADSLVGAALTGDAPLLFTQTDALPPQTRAEIDRLLADTGVPTVYILGGNAAVSDAVEEELDADYIVSRLAGPTRVETSVEVAELVAGIADARGQDVTQVAVARAGGPADNPTAAWADSVSSGAWTAAELIPTVVTDTDSLHPVVADFIDRRADLEETILLGGTSALSPAVADAVPNPRRIAGDSRADTARLIAAQLIGEPDDGAREAVAINGFREDGWLFGLPAAGLAADTDASIALAGDPLPPQTAEQLCDPAGIDILLAGGLGAIPAATAEQIESTDACG